MVLFPRDLIKLTCEEIVNERGNIIPMTIIENKEDGEDANYEENANV